MKKIIKINDVRAFSRIFYLFISLMILTTTCIYSHTLDRYYCEYRKNTDLRELMDDYDRELQAWKSSTDYPNAVVYTRNDAEIEAYNLVCAIGTSKEQKIFGYNVSYVLKVITAEGGDVEEDVNGVTQCIYNAIQRYKKVEGVTYTPEQIVHKDKYCNPSSYISYSAKMAFIKIFIEGYTYEQYGDSVIFYNPLVLGHTNVSHEKYTKEYTTSSGVRFFSK